MPPSPPTSVGSDTVRPPAEAELHAYVDGQLPPDRRDEVEAFLATHPAVARQVADWRAQNQALKGLLDSVLDEAVPPGLRQAVAGPSWPWRHLAAGVVIAALSAGSAWWARGRADAEAWRMATTTPLLLQANESASARAKATTNANANANANANTLPMFAQRAAVAHAVYSPEIRRPVEVGADQEQALVTWLTKRMDATVPVRPPDLRGQGYSLIGGRLLPGERKPVAQFMFASAGGQRLTLYVSREDAGNETSFRFGHDGAVNVFYWVDKDFGYAISAGADREELLRVSQAVYDQLSPR